MSFACIVQLFHHFIGLKWRHPGVRRVDDCGKLPMGLKVESAVSAWERKTSNPAQSAL